MKRCAIFLLLLLVPNLSGAKETDCSDLVETTRKANVIVIATVKAVGTSPGFWSGVLTARQTVTYGKDQVLKGRFGLTEFAVEHTLVTGTQIADPNVPQLDKRMFRHGGKLILFLHVRSVTTPDGKQRLVVEVLEGDCSVISATQHNVLKVRQLLAEAGA